MPRLPARDRKTSVITTVAQPIILTIYVWGTGTLLDTSTGLLTGSYHVLSLALAALLLMPVFFLLTHTPLIEDDSTKGAVALTIFLVLLAACHTFLGRIRVSQTLLV